ncbi:MAG: hypothetical protein ABIO82_08330 [Ginsengibacter sp.]
MNPSLTTKEDFLRNEFVVLLNKLDGKEKGKWGVMSAQQMVEHFSDAIKNASGKLALPTLHEGERLMKSREFLMSNLPFKENTNNPLIPQTGVPLRQPGISSAIKKLQSELDYFFEVFNKNPNLNTTNAFFGDLNYEMNIQLLHKHALHHLRQFGLI